jgi:SAM-dependent methyltransferase
MRRGGARFDKILTVGHQRLSLHNRDLAGLVREFGLTPIAASAARPFHCYAEDFLREVLDVRDLVILDASPYEGATLIHDLNTPVGTDTNNEFDAVIDGGSLEHVFNVPVALASLMRMTKVGGHIYLSNPANNLCGHGFYQFSPELMFQVFSAERGFALRDVQLTAARFPSVEASPASRIFRVSDPRQSGRRVGLMTRKASMLLVVAEKTSHVEDPFGAPVHQSDYSARWQSNRPGGSEPRRAIGFLPVAARRRLQAYRQRRAFSFRNRKFYQPL